MGKLAKKRRIEQKRWEAIVKENSKLDFSFWLPLTTMSLSTFFYNDCGLFLLWTFGLFIVDVALKVIKKRMVKELETPNENKRVPKSKRKKQQACLEPKIISQNNSTNQNAGSDCSQGSIDPKADVPKIEDFVKSKVMCDNPGIKYSFISFLYKNKHHRLCEDLQTQM